jgi:hypothetical protein
MKTIRRSVFETNSSSMHSISLASNGKIQVPLFPLVLECGEFGRGYDEFNDPQTKLSYVLTMLQYKAKYYRLEWPEEWTKLSNEEKDNYWKLEAKTRETGILTSNEYKWIIELLIELGVYDFQGLQYDEKAFYPFGYVDHQSTDTLDELWSDDEYIFKENMKNFIFNPAYTLIIDNDNH